MPTKLEIYKASAGSGKTYTLTQKYLGYLFQSTNTTHRNILAVTFTNKATEEMKARILKELYLISIKASKSDHKDFFCKKLKKTEEELALQAKIILQQLLNEYSAFQISTIDRFFLAIIQMFTREMSINGNYNIELDTDTLLNDAIENMLTHLDEDENKDLLAWLICYVDDLINNNQSWDPKKNISDLAQELFKESFRSQLTDTQLQSKGKLSDIQQSLRKIKSDFEKKVDEKVKDIENLLNQNGLNVNDFPYKEKGFMGNALNIKKKNYEINKRLSAALDAKSADEWSKNSSKKQQIDGIFVELYRYLSDMVNYIQNERRKYNSASEISKNIYTVGILSDVEKEVDKIVRKEHLLLLSRASEFLSKIIQNTDTPFIYEKLGSRIQHFMIDEFQDTSALQWNNFRPLIQESLSNGHENLLVGDVKQSIYRWRNSDWDLLNTQLKQNPENSGIKGFIKEFNLETNYRSCKNVVLFNNTFFALAAKEVEGAFQAIEGQDGLFTEKIKAAYSKVWQKVKPQKSETDVYDGYVAVQFIEADKETSWKEIALEKMSDKIELLRERGVALSDIAVLVRKNDEAALVAEYLLQRGIKILSNEALTIRNAKSVQFIIALLSYLVSPNDKPNRLFLLQRYYFLCDSPQQSLQKAIESVNEDIDQLLFPQGSISMLKRGSLFEQVEALINHFRLVEKCKDEVPFLQAMQDVIFEYETKKGNDLSKFLTYWKETKKLNLNVPNAADAIRIMTVHSSKGLEFKNVIIPFFDWSLEPKTNTRIWCGTKNVKEKPFTDLPIVPMAYNGKMKESYFSEFYLREKMLNYIDTLNVAYVAFTRAAERLYIVAPTSKSENLSMPAILSNTLKDGKPEVEECVDKNLFLSMKDDMRKAENDEENLFFVGAEESTSMSKDVEKTEYEGTNRISYFTRKEVDYHLVDKNEKWNSDQNSRIHGLLMHDILSNVKTFADIDVSFRTFEREGRLTSEETNVLRAKIISFIEKNNLKKWFSDEYRVLNEVEILQQGKTLRPDRVLMKGNHVIVIDYKFGRKTSDEYREQVRRYQTAIQEMGYTTEGYLCYVEQNVVEQV